MRDVSGKEIAVYHSNDLDHWNVWGTDNVGKINANGDKFFYIKDHLGSVRVVLNSDNQIVSAQDYDCLGYPLENRSFNSEDINYKFTGKQRDPETGYDYFGARYYDARVGRWGGVEPLLNKYISFSPYQYGLLNPMKLVDGNGKDVIVTIDGKNVTVTMTMYYITEGQNGYKFNTAEKLALLQKYMSEAETEWNEAAQDYNAESEYIVSFKVNLVENNDIKETNIPEGENMAYYQKNGDAPGVEKGNQLRIVPLITESSNFKFTKTSPLHTGSHEFGHVIGLPHIGAKGSKEQSESEDVMGYNKNRRSPSKDDVKIFMNKIDKGKNKQIIPGDKSTY